jgi:GrpB-like predicted nucleotidyltransferase (UPF0157 family)
MLRCVQIGDPGIERHLAFRDYLRAHPRVAAEYGMLKAGLAQQFPEDIGGYMDGKDAFVKAAEQEALRRYRAQGAQQPNLPPCAEGRPAGQARG